MKKLPARRAYLLAAIGCGFLAVVASWFLWSQSTQDIVETPYLEAAVDVKVSDELVALANLVDGSDVKQYDLKLDGIQPSIVTFNALEVEGKSPLVIDWQSHVNQPIFRSDINAKEEFQLVQALREHLPKEATIFAMPELSLRLTQFMGDADIPLANTPTLASSEIPQGWLDESVVPFAQSQYSKPANEKVTLLWESFRDAMVAEDIYGAARLRTLAPNEESYIIVHLRDIFDLGSVLGESLLVGMKDFESSAHAHDLTRHIKDWRSVNNFVSHAVMKAPNGRLRAYFLADAKDKSTIIGQLLPFDGSRIGLVPGTKLVFQTGGYWVYKLRPV